MGIVVLMWAVYVIYLAVFNYLADGRWSLDRVHAARSADLPTLAPLSAYLIYASSALAAQSFARNIFGFAFPLFVEQM